MKNLDDLIDSAVDLAERGASRGEIADELNVSRETASWLVERGLGEDATPRTGPQDIHVDWSTIGLSSDRLGLVSRAIADMVADQRERIDLTVGIEQAGVPLATVVAQELETDLATYTPRKHQWEEGDIEDLGGSFSRNFAPVDGQNVVVVDDTITSGTTMTETVEAVEERGGTPVAGCVLVDKRGVERLAEVPITSLVQVIQVSEE